MSDPYVREVGRIEDPDGDDIVVGVDYDTVVIDCYGSHLTQAQVEEFAQLISSATWQAGQQAPRRIRLRVRLGLRVPGLPAARGAGR